jgi:hypothetical protein
MTEVVLYLVVELFKDPLELALLEVKPLQLMEPGLDLNENRLKRKLQIV